MRHESGVIGLGYGYEEAGYSMIGLVRVSSGWIQAKVAPFYCEKRNDAVAAARGSDVGGFGEGGPGRGVGGIRPLRRSRQHSTMESASCASDIFPSLLPLNFTLIIDSTTVKIRVHFDVESERRSSRAAGETTSSELHTGNTFWINKLLVCKNTLDPGCIVSVATKAGVDVVCCGSKSQHLAYSKRFGDRRIHFLQQPTARFIAAFSRQFMIVKEDVPFPNLPFLPPPYIEL
ncbi:hypothetical protein LSTR_LSTR010789 [Laodelphax striatellus]|uniref:Uncharacterized protein n=1 Tax=Laodelphax striatellus TaxID=195883 RepID=A0A482X5V1_LAOST|nr:hypothetical protein LSTR_LSTR010789 [Laodelphax striatellus]